MKTAIKRHGTTIIDTLTVRLDTIIPKDSVIVSFKHDTLKTYERIIEKQGRATVIIEKHFDHYRVQAECDSIIIRDTLKVPYEKIVIKKEIKTKIRFRDWVVVFFIGLVILVAIILIYKNERIM